MTYSKCYFRMKWKSRDRLFDNISLQRIGDEMKKFMRLIRAIPAVWGAWKMAYQEVSGEPFLFTLEWWRKARTQIHRKASILWRTFSVIVGLVILWKLLSGSLVPGVEGVAGVYLWACLMFFTSGVVFYYHSRKFCHRCGHDFNAQRPRHIHYTFSNGKWVGRTALCRECTTPQDEEAAVGRGLVTWREK